MFNCLCGCVFFSLFFLSDKRSARKVRERFCSFKRSDSLSEEGVCGSNPKHYKARRIFSLSLVLFYFPRTRGRQKRFLLLLSCFLLSSSPNLSSLFTTRSRKSRFCDHTCSDLLRPVLTHTLPNRRAWTARRKIHSGPRSRSGRLYV